MAKSTTAPRRRPSQPSHEATAPEDIAWKLAARLADMPSATIVLNARRTREG
jgi:hypothetical protein